jgi:hypothetical protein
MIASLWVKLCEAEGGSHVDGEVPNLASGQLKDHISRITATGYRDDLSIHG